MNKEELYLANEYEFKVFVAFTPGKYHLGNLRLSPNEITIQFSCEYNEGDKQETFDEHYAEIQCNNFHDHFLLMDISMINIENGFLGPSTSNKQYHKGEYSVKYVMRYTSMLFTSDHIFGISIDSSDIKKWIGNTIKQEEILSNYESKSLNGIDVSEFRIAEKLSFTQKEYFSNDINVQLITQVKIFLKNNGVPSRDVSRYSKRIERIYESKYNTETILLKTFGCIKEFLPENAQNSEVIGKMTKLRNDITHANEYAINDSTLQFYINLLDVMVLYLILLKLLGVKDDIISRVMPRHEQIQRMVIPKIYRITNSVKTDILHNDTGETS